MSKDDKSRIFHESLVSAYFEAEIRRVWAVLSQVIEAEGPESEARKILKLALEQAWVRFINFLRQNPKYRHVLVAALRRAGFEEIMPYKKTENR